MKDVLLIRMAIDHHRAGRKTAARQLYLQVLDENPAHPDALHLLGVLAYEEREYDRAIDLIRKGIEIEPRQSAYHHNLGNALLAKDDFFSAQQAYGTALGLRPGYGEAYFGLGNAFFHQQKYKQAISSYRRCLAIMPRMVNAWFNLGKTYFYMNEEESARWCFQKVVALAPCHAEACRELVQLYSQAGRVDIAISYQRRLVQIDQDAWQPLVNLAGLLTSSGAFEKAIACYDQARGRSAPQEILLVGLGGVYKSMGELVAAKKCYRDALRIDPRCSTAYHYLANLYLEAGQPEPALDVFRQGHAHGVLCAESLYNFAYSLCRVGRRDESIPIYHQALQLQPASDRIWNGLGNAHRQAGRFETAEACFQEAVKINSNNALTYFYLGQTRQVQGEIEQCKSEFAASLQRDKNLVAAGWSYHLALPVIYDDPGEILSYRKHFADGLDALISGTLLASAQQRGAAFEAVCQHTNFYLAYQGMDDLPLQHKYGQLVARIVHARYPDLHLKNPRTERLSGRRIKVGFISAHFYAHTVAYLFEGWIRGLDRNLFEVSVYSLGQIRDSVISRIASICRYREFDGDFEKFARRVLSDQPDVLIYPDIGMHSMTMCFAALRLAPVQCVAWGHPVTTGLPSMDYFLSSEMMEPENGQAHYSETLIRLPNLSVAVEPPAMPGEPKSRQQFGLRKEAFIFLSCQSLFKYLPGFDELLAEIAAGVPNVQIVFVAHPSEKATRRFKRRVASAFAKFGLDMEKICVILPRMSLDDFMSLNMVCDVVLDPPEWSGGKTALESLWCGKPVVTLPGQFMRGRHSYAMLKKMAIEETIAGDEDHYVAIARRLGNDIGFLGVVKEKLMARRYLLFNDKSAVEALEHFLMTAVNGGNKTN